MSSDNEQLTPTPFDLAQPSPPPSSTVKTVERQGTAPWVLPALGGLLLLAVLVIFWLPDRLDPAQPEVPADAAAQQPVNTANAVPHTPASKPASATTDASPWSEAQLAKLRKEAQEVLEQLLDIQFALEERGVKQWAPERFAAVAGVAAAGDELYKTREYEQAKARYEEALTELQSLQDGIPAQLAGQLELARQAIEDGEQTTADSALELAGLIEPDSAEVAALRQRAALLPQLLPLLDEAMAAEKNGDLAAAEQLLQQAAALDPQHQRTSSELQRVAAAHQAQRFNDAMSDGYSALDEDRFADARTAFRAAAKLQEGSDEAASALQEVETTETAYRLASLKRSGGQSEQKERWQDAVNAYQKAQKIDGNVLFASAGLKRSRSRARLDKQFRTAIDEPARLSDVAVAEATAQLLKQAQQITPRGPVLKTQIDRLQVLLQQANKQVSVALRSDMETEVIVYKVARLGRFQLHELTLRPGTYTAVGTRNGYRDVRHSFTIRHDSAPAPVTIACTEPI
jgi:tetratricopeptide (TPR) repeat protein